MAKKTEVATRPGTALVIQRHKTITESTSAFLGVDPAKVFDLLRGVWTVTAGKTPLSNQELMVGMALVSRYELDPFAREIYVTRDNKGKLMVVVGVDGWIRVLNRTPGYDGFEQELVMDGDDIKEVVTRIYSKDRSHPASYRAFATDYAKLGGFMLAKIPGHMLRIFSLKHAARLFTPLGCVVTEEEAEWMAAAPPEPVNSLAELTEKLTEDGTDLACSTVTPGTLAALERQAEDDAEQEAEAARLCDEFATLLAETDSAAGVATWITEIVGHVATGKITEEEAGGLYELANSAKDRLSKVT